VVEHLWILEDDQNTKFFHRLANIKKKFNAIQSICVHGACFDDIPAVKGVIVNFYYELYREDHLGRSFLKGLSYD